ncbi:MAG: urease accessory protein [Gammaproteobacteria bacterium]
MLALLFVGFLFGLRHALEADHLAAVVAISSGSHSPAQSVRQGVAWGVGHSATLLVIGSIALSLDTLIPVLFAGTLELIVGFALVALGFDVLRRVLRQRLHGHFHSHGDGTRHCHLHSHLRRPEHDHKHREAIPVRALLIGFVHGTAGSAALILIALQSTTSFWWGVAYIVLFGVGSIVGMGLLSAVITWPARYSKSGMAWLQTAAGFVTIAIGAHLIYAIGIAKGLFNAGFGTLVAMM